MREKYESMPLVKLRELAKSLGMRGISSTKKGDLIELLIARDEKDMPKKTEQDAEDRPAQEGTVQVPKKKPAQREPAKNMETAENVQQDAEKISAADTQTLEAPSGENTQDTGMAAEGNGMTSAVNTQSTQGTGTVSGGGQKDGMRSRNIVRTPRDNGMRTRRDNGYGGNYSYTRNNTAARRDASSVAEKRTNYTSYADKGENAPAPERSQSPAPERRNVYQEAERRDTPVLSERQDGSLAADTSVDKPPMDLAQLDSGISVGGILEASSRTTIRA